MLNIPLFFKKNIFSKIRFFPLAVIEQNNLDHNIRKVVSFSVFKNNILKSIFKNNILKSIRPFPISVFDCETHREIKLVTRLGVDLSHLRECKFKHSF